MVIVCLRIERAEQHEAGVVDEDVGAAELSLDSCGGLDDGAAVGDVGLDGDGAVAELVGQRLDAVAASREQGQPVAAGGERAGRGLPMPDEAPVMTATRPAPWSAVVLMG